jgi:regulator of sigma E protease
VTLIVFILILSILIFVHELGHFLAAKKAGILVEEFGFGLPPRIWGKKVGETIYSLNALPIGGFVKLYGENGEDEVASVEPVINEGRAYFEKSIWQRTAVLLAGVTMNLLLAIVAFSILYFVYGIPTKTGKIKIVGIAKDSPAEMAQLKPDDLVIAIDGQRIEKTEEFVKLAKEKAGKTVRLEIQREKDNPCQESQKVLGGMASREATVTCQDGNLLVSLIPRENPPADEGPLGVAISDTEMRKYPWWQMPFLGAREGFKESLSWGGMILGGLKNTLVTLVLKGQVPKDVAGPVGIFQITGEATKNGVLAVLQFLGILSVNLAIINILPLPALDGGRLIFLGYEAVTRKKANPKVESWVNTAGMAFLLALMLLITVNDILRLVRR